MQNDVGEKAGATTCNRSEPMRREAQENRVKRFVIAITTRSLAAFIALSFLATLLPAGVFAAKTTMACCAGKAAGHCHSGLPVKESTPAHDHNIIVAESNDSSNAETASQRSVAETTAVRRSCNSDCCACSVSTVRQQQKRQRGTVQAKVHYHAPVLVLAETKERPLNVSSHDEGTQVSPRGPPAFLL